MNKNSTNFILASEQVKKLKVRPTNTELLDLYGFYKHL